MLKIDIQMSSQFAKSKNVYGLLSAFLISNVALMLAPAIAQEKTCILNENGQKVCGSVIQSSDNSPGKSSRSVSTLIFPRANYNFKVQLMKCVRRLRTVDCKFSIIKVGGESSVELELIANSGSKVSQATDSQNRSYNAKQLTIGNEKTMSYRSEKLNTGQPISVILSFPIPKEVKTLKKLTLETQHFDDYSTVIFSNVNIYR
jgi:hypothetical protein